MRNRNIYLGLFAFFLTGGALLVYFHIALAAFDCARCSNAYDCTWATFQSTRADCSDVISGTVSYSCNNSCGTGKTLGNVLNCCKFDCARCSNVYDYAFAKFQSTTSDCNKPITGSVVYSRDCACGVKGTDYNPSWTNYCEPPVAVATISKQPGNYSDSITVTRGTPVFIYLSADGSSDPSGWTDSDFGVSDGGKCEWNSDLNQGAPTFETTINNPASPSACNISLGQRAFYDEPGTYTYQVLRITDKAGVVSNIGTVQVTVQARCSRCSNVKAYAWAVWGAGPDNVCDTADDDYGSVIYRCESSCPFRIRCHRCSNVYDYAEALWYPGPDYICDTTDDDYGNVVYRCAGWNGASGCPAVSGQSPPGMTCSAGSLLPSSTLCSRCSNVYSYAWALWPPGPDNLCDSPVSAPDDEYSRAAYMCVGKSVCPVRSPDQSPPGMTCSADSIPPASRLCYRYSNVYDYAWAYWPSGPDNVCDTHDDDYSNPVYTCSCPITPPPPPPPANTAPIAVATISKDGSTYADSISVTQGVATPIYLSAAGSSDPNGWTDPTNGVSSGGKCEWNKDLNQGTPTFEQTVNDPASPSACNISLGNKTFNDAPGTYTYQILRITDKPGLQSNIDTVSVIIVQSPANNPPSATNLNAQIFPNPTECTISYVGARISWTFTDPDSGDTQSAYQVQVDNNSNFSSPEDDSGKVNSSSNSYVTPLGKLAYNTTYYWRLMVWDSKDLASSWISGPSFTTPKHAYPTIDFSWTPQEPSVDELVQFTDQSTVYGGATKVSWSWTFQDGNPSGSSKQNATTTFTSTGPKTVTLRVTDSDGFSCPGQKTVNAQMPLPEWKEVAADYLASPPHQSFWCGGEEFFSRSH